MYVQRILDVCVACLVSVLVLGTCVGSFGHVCVCVESIWCVVGVWKRFCVCVCGQYLVCVGCFGRMCVCVTDVCVCVWRVFGVCVGCFGRVCVCVWEVLGCVCGRCRVVSVGGAGLCLWEGEGWCVCVWVCGIVCCRM